MVSGHTKKSVVVIESCDDVKTLTMWKSLLDARVIDASPSSLAPR